MLSGIFKATCKPPPAHPVVQRRRETVETIKALDNVMSVIFIHICTLSVIIVFLHQDFLLCSNTYLGDNE